MKGKKLEHMGIRVELIGAIENAIEKNQTVQFMTLVRDLEAPGILSTDNISYDFNFNAVNMPYETYSGFAVRLRYYINVVINRSFGKITKEEDFLV